MNFTASGIYVIDGIVELVSLVAFADFLGILSRKQIGRKRAVFSLIAYIGISALEMFFTNTFGNSIEFLSAILYLLKLVLTIYIMYSQLNFKIIYLIVFWDLSIYLIASNMSCILANLLGKYTEDVLPYIKMLIQIALFIIILIIRKNNNPQRNMSALSTIPPHIFIMLILAIICLSALSSLISYPTDNRVKKENTLTLIVIILTVILLCIIVSLFLNVIAKQHFTAVSQMMEKQVQLQIGHYEELEKMDSEIRRFRHDYTNHLRSILTLIQMKEYAQAAEYIEKLQKIKYNSAMAIFYTGNKLADALLADKSAALADNCRIEYSGIIPSTIENVDLCVILSNALDNAAEACSEFAAPCLISISAGERQGYFVMSITNPTTCPYNYYDIPPTTKHDKDLHGMGLFNIESAVRKYGGQIKVKCENGMFELMVVLKI